jgi:two-component system, OmpR family, response regulator
MKILIVEDDPILAKNIHAALSAEGYHTENVYDGTLAFKLMTKNQYDCIVMDINLPGTNGFDLCKQYRSINTQTPVLLLTAFSDLDDKIKGYDNGADDYLTKPFFMQELLLRIKALLKRKEQNYISSTGDTLVAGDIQIFPLQKKVERQGDEIKLTPREYQILLKLVQNSGELVSKNDLIAEIWGSNVDANTNTIEVYINFLRNKIDKPYQRNSIKTKVGYGYYFDVHEN